MLLLLRLHFEHLGIVFSITSFCRAPRSFHPYLFTRFYCVSCRHTHGNGFTKFFMSSFWRTINYLHLCIPCYSRTQPMPIQVEYSDDERQLIIKLWQLSHAFNRIQSIYCTPRKRGAVGLATWGYYPAAASNTSKLRQII